MKSFEPQIEWRDPAIRSDAGFAVDNLDLVGVFAEGGIVEDEVRAGLFDGAEIAIALVNWQDPDGHGEIRLRRGTLGETRLTPQGYFHAELRACPSRSRRARSRCTRRCAGRTSGIETWVNTLSWPTRAVVCRKDGSYILYNYGGSFSLYLFGPDNRLQYDIAGTLGNGTWGYIVGSYDKDAGRTTKASI